ncbi:MAG: PQQ-binding-like beta-propeller repeat protein, partial [Prolixibacteraceae bacterium]|nr:PQQ-binding-like beta-propeller repeat protein [Prolixibacteraceae bacterium]
MKILTVFALALILFSANGQSTHNWNQYLGPHRNATITDAGISRTWPEEGPSKVWEFPLQSGYGGAAIYNDEVFVLDRNVGESDVLRCIDFETGKEKWNFEYEAKGRLPYPGSRATPTVDENYVWSVGPHGHMHCVDKNSHQSVWSHKLLEKYGGELQRWGFSLSPIVYNDLVIVAPQGEKSGVVAFNKLSGEVVWESRPLTGQRFHVSPTMGNYGGVDQVIMISSCHKGDGLTTDEVIAFEVNTGAELWKYEGLNSFASINPAIIVDDKRLLLSECAYNDKYNPVSVMLEITKIGDKFNIEELFFNTAAGSKMHPPVIFDNHIYLNNTKRPGMQMTCLTMDGEVVWEDDAAPGFGLGAIIMIDGLIINQNG